jgi:hypothetical protein
MKEAATDRLTQPRFRRNFNDIARTQRPGPGGWPVHRPTSLPPLIHSAHLQSAPPSSAPRAKPHLRAGRQAGIVARTKNCADASAKQDRAISKYASQRAPGGEGAQFEMMNNEAPLSVDFIGAAITDVPSKLPANCPRQISGGPAPNDASALGNGGTSRQWACACIMSDLV